MSFDIACRVLTYGQALLRAPCRTSPSIRDGLLSSRLTPQERSKPGRVRVERRWPASSLDSLGPHCSRSTTHTALSSWYSHSKQFKVSSAPHSFDPKYQ